MSRTLELDAFVPDEAIKVSVSGGWITLGDEVTWEHQRREAERVVRTLTGVKGFTKQMPSTDLLEWPAMLASAPERHESVLLRSSRAHATV